MKENWQIFMLGSNKIEGEDRLNPGDEEAFHFACAGIETLKEILALHHILGKYLKADWVGKWRTCNVRVGMYCPPKHKDVLSQMEKYMTVYPALNSYEAHNQFEAIHPFRDLNGRVGRLIWLSKAVNNEDYDLSIPFLQKYYYQTLGEQK